MAGTRLGRYEVIEPIGSGGMGEVYRASDPALERYVATKIVRGGSDDPIQATKRLQEEAKLQASVSHPNVVPIYDVGIHENQAYIVTELLEGETLRSRLARGSPGCGQALDWAIEIAEGLSAAHSKGVIHRDLKPENIFITREGSVRILDFGLARSWRPDPSDVSPDDSTREFERGRVIGTLHYMSPEQLTADEIDHRTDIFAFGCVLYEMLTGERLFAGRTIAETIGRILNDEVTTSCDSIEAPQGLSRVIARCLEKSPDERFQTARDLAFSLEEMAGTRSHRAPRAAPRRVYRRRILIAGAAAGLLLVLIALIVRFVPARSPHPHRSLAVLPFEDRSADADGEYLGDGITETLINSFSGIPDLRIVPRSTVFGFRDRIEDVDSLDDLGADTILSGRILNRGNALNLQVDLVDVSSRSQIWGQQYDFSRAEIFDVEGRVVLEVARALGLRLSKDQRKRITHRTTVNADAYELYLKGRYHWNKRTAEGMAKGIEYFQRAIDTDPGYALAWAGLADSFVTIGVRDAVHPREIFTKASAAAERALKLDASSVEAQTSLAAIHDVYEWDAVEAERAFRVALDLDPGYATAHAWDAIFLARRSRLSEATDRIRLAVSLEPLSITGHLNEALIHYLSRNPGAALGSCEIAVELEPENPGIHTIRGMALQQLGDVDGAATSFRRAIERSGGMSTPGAALAHLYATTGREEEARRILANLIQSRNGSYISAANIALVHVGLGEVDEAFEWLETAVADRSPLLTYAGTDPRLDPIRDDPRFESILQRVGLHD